MQELQNKPNISQMFNIQEKENGEIAISGRELHEALEIKTRYNDWFERMQSYGYQENVDFVAITQKRVTAQGNVTTYIDHALTINTAKEIAMIQRNEIGRAVRQHFIRIEDAWNSPEMIVERALQIQTNKVEKLEAQVEENKPKVLFADSVIGSQSSILIGELAKLLKQNGVNIGQNRLFEWMRENGYLIKQKGENYNLPTQRSADLEIMDIKKRTINNPDGSSQITRTTKITGKGQQYFINKFLSE
ncbi:phage antirepressor KilAC domain-containing protein [Staphylococcus pseudoxylosus]|uniref:Oxidoreductase n=1 Tax=Staphylococcus pseudoxylosus TaxID=2282419 RepID=A0AAQ0S777_9STAP|nr:phage antirepressor KilAC domain-containing protein [Staphylococcus pseudoxylosus]MCE5001708.1 phage antirepressor KilAC domain-containing protein [Staphylococcus pseudoxylosus]RMI85633.1 oxidoreductase [Staphylococcus pseudoxylosus]